MGVHEVMKIAANNPHTREKSVARFIVLEKQHFDGGRSI